ncbi:putative integral membrane protein [Haloplasma contractile SSD-17B]|uniref:Integral membrane protein n=1 Tax=Haloplasma contractile SSD-17B TaxID=1033810 RepID=U2E8Q1_9MOLU|nr:putative integral membrane protein [Haloplasma contractile SSD-17B]
MNKPGITPPTYVFGIVWTIMYILISFSVARTLTTNTEDNKRCYIILFILNYTLIQLYSYLQFGLKNLELAFINIMLVLVTSVLLYYFTKVINKKAAYILIPLILWVIYASFLQIGFLRLN